MSVAEVPEPAVPPSCAASVVAVSASREHGFSKQTWPVIRLLEGLGVEGDAHLGSTVQHLHPKRHTPSAPNLRQVHLVGTELFEELRRCGHRVLPGELGENVATTGVDLQALPVGTLLLLGESAEVRLTGLRNPCWQIDRFQAGLLRQVLGRDADGTVVRRAGVMGVVRRGGEVRPGDPVAVVLPEEPHTSLAVV